MFTLRGARLTADMARWRLDLADGDRCGVTPCLVGRRRQFCKWRVGRVTGVESKRVGVNAVEPFDERFRGKCSAAGRATHTPALIRPPPARGLATLFR